ncbi:MAG TPA: GNAT family N-acetyltransferase [Amycolatopsis sp.]|nr:GNAT family N-acetyltransferase [Amycolatopsis sp.]
MTATAAPPLRLRVNGFGALGARELDAWHSLRAGNPALDSPYFHPLFAKAVHDSGTRVSVVVAEDPDGAIRAIMPLDANGRTVRPAGWPAADFQGPILAPGTRFPVPALLGSLGAHTFAFDHLLDGRPEFAPWIRHRSPSPYLDVSGGLPGYLGRASRSGKENMGQARRRARKLAGEHGDLKFIVDNRDPDVLDQVIQLKRGQYIATGARDYFAVPERKSFLHGMLATREGSFRGLLSTVHCGDELVAAHFGMCDGAVLHWWFPVYDPAFSRFAPGWILLRELTDAAPQLGVTRIDLGRGEDEYKRRAMTGQVEVCEGRIIANPWRRAVRNAADAAVAAAKRSPVRDQLRAVVRRVR